MASSSDTRSKASGLSSSLVRFQPYYSVQQYIWQEGMRYGAWRLVALPDLPGAFGKMRKILKLLENYRVKVQTISSLMGLTKTYNISTNLSTA